MIFNFKSHTQNLEEEKFTHTHTHQLFCKLLHQSTKNLPVNMKGE